MLCGWVIYLVNDRYRTRQAISWWQDRQMQRLHQETELIRDRMLQDLFSLRRGIGLVLDGSYPESKLEATLAIADQCHVDLAALSDRLFSPYAIDSLEVALSELVEYWQKQYPTSHFAYREDSNAKSDRPIDSTVQPNYQPLLIWLDELCGLLVNQPQPMKLEIILQPQGKHMKLTVTIKTLTAQAGAVELRLRPPMNHFKRILSILYKGRCTFRYQADEWWIQALLETR